jgi:beta-phosphoglucomutase-like phosphatase (HAD superfamily)
VSIGIDAVVFDFDGLILDTESPIFTAWCAAFDAHRWQAGSDVPATIPLIPWRVQSAD